MKKQTTKSSSTDPTPPRLSEDDSHSPHPSSHNSNSILRKRAAQLMMDVDLDSSAPTDLHPPPTVERNPIQSRKKHVANKKKKKEPTHVALPPRECITASPAIKHKDAASSVVVTPATTSAQAKKLRENTLDVGPDGYVHNLVDDPNEQQIILPPGSVILLPYTTTIENDNVSQQTPQLGAQETAYVAAAHSSPFNTLGNKTPDIDELTAMNDVLAPEITNSPYPTHPSIVHMENGFTPLVDTADVQADLTNTSKDELDVMVNNMFDLDSPLDEVDEDSDHVIVNGFKVSQEFESIARKIIEKRGDIFASASVTGLFRSHLFNSVCSISQKVAKSTLFELSLSQIKSLRQNVEELLNMNVDVTWLLKTLDNLHERKTMGQQLRDLLQKRKQDRMVIVALEKERELQLKIVQKAKQMIEDIDIRVKAVAETNDQIYKTVLSEVAKMQQYKNKPLKDVEGVEYF